MAEYELCCEIFNQCSNNQMRDVDFQEVSVEDTEAYVRSLEPRAEIERRSSAAGRWPTTPTPPDCASAILLRHCDRRRVFVM